MADSDSSATPYPLRVLVDTNVALDQLLARQPWFAQAQPLWQARDDGRVIAFLSTTTITARYYIAGAKWAAMKRTASWSVACASLA